MKTEPKKKRFGGEALEDICNTNHAHNNTISNKNNTLNPLPALDFTNVVAHLKSYCIPALYRDGPNVRIEFLKKATSKKRLTYQAATKKLAEELQVLDRNLQVSEMGRAV